MTPDKAALADKIQEYALLGYCSTAVELVHVMSVADRNTILAALRADGMRETIDLTDVLDFLNKIEGDGYGGMASFEIAREKVRRIVKDKP